VTEYRSKRRAQLTPARRNTDIPTPYSSAERFTTKAPRTRRKNIHHRDAEARRKDSGGWRQTADGRANPGAVVVRRRSNNDVRRSGRILAAVRAVIANVDSMRVAAPERRHSGGQRESRIRRCNGRWAPPLRGCTNPLPSRIEAFINAYPKASRFFASRSASSGQLRWPELVNAPETGAVRN